MPVRIALVAGEASGDLLGAGLIAELRKRYPDAQFAGIGGDAMRGAGMDTWFDAAELAVMGLSEVLRHLPRLLRLRRSLRERVLACSRGEPCSPFAVRKATATARSTASRRRSRSVCRPLAAAGEPARAFHL